jgi:hypothetical protein
MKCHINGISDILQRVTTKDKVVTIHNTAVIPN